MSDVSNAVDTWDEETNHRPVAVSASGSAGGSKPKVSAPAVVRDDWEVDDEEDEQDNRPTEEQNKQIWEYANNQEQHPMPSLVIARGSSSIPATPSLPLNQPPTMRILKRPSPSQSPSQSSTNSSNGETFQQREARYQAARERILGASTEGLQEPGQKKNSSQKSLPSQTPPPNPSTTVVREPRGPSISSTVGSAASQNKGFGERKANRPPPSTKALPTTTTSISS